MAGSGRRWLAEAALSGRRAALRRRWVGYYAGEERLERAKKKPPELISAYGAGKAGRQRSNRDNVLEKAAPIDPQDRLQRCRKSIWNQALISELR